MNLSQNSGYSVANNKSLLETANNCTATRSFDSTKEFNFLFSQENLMC